MVVYLEEVYVCITVQVKIVSEFMYELPKIEWSRNVMFAASRDYGVNVMPHLRLNGNMSL